MPSLCITASAMVRACVARRRWRSRRARRPRSQPERCHHAAALRVLAQSTTEDAVDALRQWADSGQQRNVEDDAARWRPRGLAPRLVADHRVQDALEPRLGRGSAKTSRAHAVAVERASAPMIRRPKAWRSAGSRRPPGRERTRDGVGVHQRRAAVDQHAGDRALAAADAAGEPMVRRTAGASGLTPAHPFQHARQADQQHATPPPARKGPKARSGLRAARR